MLEIVCSLQPLAPLPAWDPRALQRSPHDRQIPTGYPGSDGWPGRQKDGEFNWGYGEGRRPDLRRLAAGDLIRGPLHHLNQLLHPSDGQASHLVQGNHRVFADHGNSSATPSGPLRAMGPGVAIAMSIISITYLHKELIADKGCA